MVKDLTVRLTADNAQPKAVRQEEVKGYQQVETAAANAYKLAATTAGTAAAAQKADADAARRSAAARDALARAIQKVAEKQKAATDPAQARQYAFAVDELTRRWEAATRAAQGYQAAAAGGSRAAQLVSGLRGQRAIAQEQFVSFATAGVPGGATAGVPAKGGAGAGGGAGMGLMVLSQFADDLQYVEQMGLRPIMGQIPMVGMALAQAFGAGSEAAMKFGGQLGIIVQGLNTIINKGPQFVGAAKTFVGLGLSMLGIGNDIGGESMSPEEQKRRAKLRAQADAKDIAQVAGIRSAEDQARATAVREGVERLGGGADFLRRVAEANGGDQATTARLVQRALTGRGQDVEELNRQARKAGMTLTFGGDIEDDLRRQQADEEMRRREIEAHNAEVDRRREATGRTPGAIAAGMMGGRNEAAFLAGDITRSQVNARVRELGIPEGERQEFGEAIWRQITEAYEAQVNARVAAGESPEQAAEALAREGEAKGAREGLQGQLAEIQMRELRRDRFRPQLLGTGAYLDSLATAGAQDTGREQVEKLQALIKKQDDIIKAVEKGQVPRFP